MPASSTWNVLQNDRSPNLKKNPSLVIEKKLIIQHTWTANVKSHAAASHLLMYAILISLDRRRLTYKDNPNIFLQSLHQFMHRKIRETAPKLMHNSG
ncbi:MAG TPA: hypothetical protein VKR53_15240 [Puia sp.]|nr:hypothetical protein [Puia sp.]